MQNCTCRSSKWLTGALRSCNFLQMNAQPQWYGCPNYRASTPKPSRVCLSVLLLCSPSGPVRRVGPLRRARDALLELFLPGSSRQPQGRRDAPRGTPKGFRRAVAHAGEAILSVYRLLEFESAQRPVCLPESSRTRERFSNNTPPRCTRGRRTAVKQLSAAT